MAVPKYNIGVVSFNGRRQYRQELKSMAQTFFNEANAMVQAEDFSWRGGHGSDRYVLRETIVMGLLGFPQKES